MKSIALVICSVLLMSLCCYSQVYKVSVAVFKNIPFNPIADSVSDNILETDAFGVSYGEKASTANIDYITWSPDMRFIAVVVSNVYTGDYDDIWIISTRDKNIRCISCIFPRNESRTFGTPIWKDVDTLVFTMSNDILTVDVPNNKIVSQLRIDWKSDPSHISPNGKLRYEDDGTGVKTTILSQDGKRIVTIGEGKTRSGSILGAAFSGDSRFLAVEQFMGHGASRIIIADLQSQSLKILNLPFILFYSIKGRSNWYPGRSVLNVTDDQGNLHFLNVIAQSETTFSIPNYYILGSAWSPDRTLLALILQKKREQTYAVRIIKNPIAY